MSFWRHYESEPLIVGPAALETAKAQTWEQVGPLTAARYLRALCVLSLQAATLSTEPKGYLGDLRAEQYADDERNAIGSAVARTLIFLPPVANYTPTHDVDTYWGIPVGLPDPGEDQGEAGALPAIAVVAIVTVCAAAAVAISENIAQVVDSTNFRNNQTQKLLAFHGKAVEIVANHSEKEKALSKVIPYSPEERSVLERLEQAQREVAKEQHIKLPGPFQGAKEFVQASSDAIVKTTTGAILPIAVVAGTFILLNNT
jgi:hypothetical protein